MESANTKKTGLSRRMREWMAARTGSKNERSFTIGDVVAALQIPAGKPHQAMLNALWDFGQRGEVTAVRKLTPHPWKSTPIDQRHFLYVHDWRAALKGSVNRKIFKAMYVSHDFAVSDIQRLTALGDRDWIDRLVRRLRSDGHIQAIRRRRCLHGAGAETVYHVVNRDKFKMEIMR